MTRTIRGISLLLLCGLSAISIVTAQTGPTGNLTVTNLNDSGPGSLRDAIAVASASSSGGEITFAVGIGGTIFLTSGPLIIGNSLTITGPGPQALTISGSKASRVFDIEGGGTVLISGLHITQGLADSEAAHPGLGGGMYVSHSKLTLSHMVIDQNQAVGVPNVVSDNGLEGVGGGGGIYNDGGVLTLVNSTLNNNTASGGGLTSGGQFGGGIFNPCGNQPVPSGGAGLGGGILNTKGTMTWSGTVVLGNNQALGGPGGAALGGGIASLNGALTFVEGNATVVANQAVGGTGDTGGSGLGGGLYTGGVLTVNAGILTIQGNTALGGDGNTVGGNGCGGGLAASPFSFWALLDAAVSGNSASGGAGGSAGNSNSGQGFGGGIYDPGVLIIDSQTVISDNTADHGSNRFPPRR